MKPVVGHLGLPIHRFRLRGAAAGTATGTAAAGGRLYAADGRASLPSTTARGASVLMEKLVARRRHADAAKAAVNAAVADVAIKTATALAASDAVAEAAAAVEWAAAGERDAPPSPDDEWFEPPPGVAAVALTAAPPAVSGSGSAAGTAVGNAMAGGAPAVDVPPSEPHEAGAAPRVAFAANTTTAAAPVRAAVARHGGVGGASATAPVEAPVSRTAGAGGRQPTRATRRRSHVPPAVVPAVPEYASMPGGGERHRAAAARRRKLEEQRLSGLFRPAAVAARRTQGRAGRPPSASAKL